MILKRVCGEPIYLDEVASEFDSVARGFLGFFIIGFVIVILPVLFYNLGPLITIFISASAIGIGGMAIVYSCWTVNRTYYDVWIPGEHRKFLKTNSGNEKVQIAIYVHELEEILKERKRLEDEMKELVVGDLK